MLLAESYLHSLDPYAFRFGDGFGIRWYGLAYVAGLLIAWGMASWMSRTERSLIPTTRVSDMMMWIIGGVLIGGRLGYVLFYDPRLLIGFEQSFPWWQALAIHQGGMASHGGILGVIVALLIFAARNRIPLLHPLDVAALIATPGLFLGRLANFVNGELWGEPWRGEGEAPAWTVKYPNEVLYNPGAFDLEPLRSTVGGEASFHERVVMEAQAGNQTVLDVLQPQLTPFYPSSLLQALSDGPILLAALVLVWWRPRKPGVIAGCFLVFYSLLRIITEFFRQPDEGVALVMGLSRGQQLSLFQMMIGLILLIWCATRRVEAVGGLGSPRAITR
jgi:phosphatidylglycerol:prolipoprotein diacylglycerol transferase